jgi:Domain of unknown function (DUF4386)
MSTLVIEKKTAPIRERQTARIAGILFITATLASIASLPFLQAVSSPNYLTDLSASANQVTLGIVLTIVGAAASASIAISMYPVLRKFNQGLALASVGFRLIEGVLYIVGGVLLVSLLTLSQQYVKAAAPNAAYFSTLGTVLLTGYHWVGYAGAPLFFSIGAFMYYLIFQRSRLVPQWLSIWGIVGAVLCGLTSLLVMSNIIGAFSTVQVVLNLPIAVQEMALAVWLIVKGFTLSPDIQELKVELHE